MTFEELGRTLQHLLGGSRTRVRRRLLVVHPESLIADEIGVQSVDLEV
jgi:hypothetical protein